MLNRRILRIKVFKTLYSSVLTQESQHPCTLDEAKNALELSCESTRDLYLFMLGIVSPLTRLAADRLAAASQKIFKTEEELNPNTKFADNALAVALDNDKDFQKIWDKKKFSWEQYDLFLKKVLNSICEKDYYKKYMAKPGRSLSEDCSLFCKIYEEEFVDSIELEAILEDMSIWWNDDLAYALSFCCRSFNEIAKTGAWTFPPLYRSDMLVKTSATAVESDKAFAYNLLKASYLNYEPYSAMVAENVSGWEKDRLVPSDLCLIVCCLSEITSFPTIPVKVSLNEYVEITKYYSTPKSSIFVNGILDRLVQKMMAEGSIKKTGKGLE